MYDFHYHRPKSLADAVGLLKGKDEARPMSGGMTLIPTLKQRLAKPSDVVDLGGIKELAGIKVEGNNVVIGAMTRHAEVANSAEVKGAIPALAHLAGHIGDPQVRNRGTIGGSIANNDPAADYPAAVVALNATVTTNTGKHTGDGFFKGLFETALGPGDVLTAIRLPLPGTDSRHAFAELARRHGDYALVGLAATARADGKALRDVRLAFFGVGATAIRARTAEAAVALGIDPVAALSRDLDPQGDVQASAAAKRHLAGVLLRRVVAQLAEPRP